jgi:lipid II:glycine glycyltransferase (peptidoglycan interpeptide bridge formation enzyme)
MKIEELESNEYEEYISKNKYTTFYQKEYWGKLKKDGGWNYKLVGMKKNNKIVGATLLLFKNLPLGLKLFYSPRGFLIDYNDEELLKEFVLEIKEYVKKENGFILKIDPYVEYKTRDIDGNIVKGGVDNSKVVENLKKLGFKHYGFNKDISKELQPRWMYVLDLKGKTEDEIFSNFSKHYRKTIRRTEKQGLVVERISKDKLMDYKKIMEHTSSRRDFIDRPYSYYENMYDKIGENLIINVCYLDTNLGINKFKDEIKKIEGYQDIKDYHLKDIEDYKKKIELYESYQKKYGDKIPLAGTMSIVCGKEYLNLFGGAYEEFMHYDAQYLIKWHTMKEALNLGCEIYNFYGISGNFEKENNDMYGVYEFKRGFGGRVVELIGEFDLIISKPKYCLYNFMFKTYKIVKKIIKK